MGLMDGKKGIVFGIANDRSYATYITKSLVEQGAECAFTHLPGDKMERRCRKAVGELGLEDPWMMPCDASNDEDLDAVFEKLAADHGTIDFLVHSIAFADREFLKVGNFHTTTREAFNQALDISAYTLVAIAVGKIDEMFKHQIEKSSMGRNIEGEEVGNTGVYLLSDLSSGVTGETIHVDAGYSIIGW